MPSAEALLVEVRRSDASFARSSTKRAALRGALAANVDKRDEAPSCRSAAAEAACAQAPAVDVGEAQRAAELCAALSVAEAAIAQTAEAEQTARSAAARSLAAMGLGLLSLHDASSLPVAAARGGGAARHGARVRPRPPCARPGPLRDELEAKARRRGRRSSSGSPPTWPSRRAGKRCCGARGADRVLDGGEGDFREAGGRRRAARSQRHPGDRVERADERRGSPLRRCRAPREAGGRARRPRSWSGSSTLRTGASRSRKQRWRRRARPGPRRGASSAAARRCPEVAHRSRATRRARRRGAGSGSEARDAARGVGTGSCGLPVAGSPRAISPLPRRWPRRRRSSRPSTPRCARAGPQTWSPSAGPLRSPTVRLAGPASRRAWKKTPRRSRSGRARGRSAPGRCRPGSRLGPSEVEAWLGAQGSLEAQLATVRRLEEELRAVSGDPPDLRGRGRGSGRPRAGTGPHAGVDGAGSRPRSGSRSSIGARKSAAAQREQVEQADAEVEKAARRAGGHRGGGDADRGGGRAAVARRGARTRRSRAKGCSGPVSAFDRSTRVVRGVEGLAGRLEQHWKTGRDAALAEIAGRSLPALEQELARLATEYDLLQRSGTSRTRSAAGSRARWGRWRPRRTPLPWSRSSPTRGPACSTRPKRWRRSRPRSGCWRRRSPPPPKRRSPCSTRAGHFLQVLTAGAYNALEIDRSGSEPTLIAVGAGDEVRQAATSPTGRSTSCGWPCAWPSPSRRRERRGYRSSSTTSSCTSTTCAPRRR